MLIVLKLRILDQGDGNKNEEKYLESRNDKFVMIEYKLRVVNIIKNVKNKFQDFDLCN